MDVVLLPPSRLMTGIDASRLKIGKRGVPNDASPPRVPGPPSGDSIIIGELLRTTLSPRVRLMIVDGDLSLLLMESNLLFPDVEVRWKNPVLGLGRDGESSNGPNKPPDNVL